MTALLRRLLAPVLASVVMTACATSGDPDSLTLWHSWGGAELATLQALIAQFRSEHPGIDVMALQIPHDTLLDKFTRSSAANGGPDILIGDNDWSGKLSEAGLILPVFEEGTAATGSASLFPVSQERRFSPQTLAALRIGHAIYAWPESVETVVLYYNRRWIPRPPSTVAQMLQMASAAHVPDGYGLVFNTDFYYFAGYFLGGGGQIFGPDRQVDVDTPAGVSMLGWLDALTNSTGVLGTNDYGKADSLYKQGKAAMILNGPWALADYQKALGPDLGVAILPKLAADQPARPWIGVKCLMVNSDIDARHRELATDFLRFMDEPKIQAQLSRGCGHIPAVLGVPTAPGSPLDVFERQALTGTPKSADPHLAVVWDPMNRAIQETLTQRHAPGEALKRTQALINAQLAELESNQ